MFVAAQPANGSQLSEGRTWMFVGAGLQQRMNRGGLWLAVMGKAEGCASGGGGKHGCASAACLKHRVWKGACAHELYTSNRGKMTKFIVIYPLPACAHCCRPRLPSQDWASPSLLWM